MYVLGVTVGEDVERRSEQLFKQGNYTVGLLLDAAATTAVEQVADQVNEVINNIAKKQGYAPTWRFSPGYGNWPLEIQPQLAKSSKPNKSDYKLQKTSYYFKKIRNSYYRFDARRSMLDNKTRLALLKKDCQSRKLKKAAATKPETSGRNIWYSYHNQQNKILTHDA